MTSTGAQAGGAVQGGGGAQYFYFVDARKYDWATPNITGAQIRASVAGLNPTFQIVLEGHATDPDRPISDDDTFSLTLPGRGPLHFYTAPPATFGFAGSMQVRSRE
jgi:hypothetical protein